MPTSPADPITAARFALTIDGYEIATFSELQGISTEVEPVQYLGSTGAEVDYNKLQGKVRLPTVVLKRGMTGGMELWAWHEAVRRGDVAGSRRSCSLTMYNTEGKAVATYWLEKAWPSKLAIDALKAGTSTVMYETVTLICEGMQRVAP